MDFSYTDEQRQLRKTVREFAEAEIKPHVREWDEKSEFPVAVIRKCGEIVISRQHARCCFRNSETLSFICRIVLLIHLLILLVI